ncbi:hypothetical protein [Clostridium sp. UBA7503]|uniref:hypothetical protein n=1 Tax=Clostridium sp. UBA7503 TaxID=1946377 RepID=UPI00321797F0
MASSASLRAEKREKEKELKKVKERITKVKAVISNVNNFTHYQQGDETNAKNISSSLLVSISNASSLASTIEDKKEEIGIDDYYIRSINNELEGELKRQERARDTLEEEIRNLSRRIQYALERERQERLERERKERERERKERERRLSGQW